jgi:hypothetical protein
MLAWSSTSSSRTLPPRVQFAAIALLLAAHALAASACGRPGTARDLDGKPVDPLAHAGVTVLAFTSTECPISRRYVPELRRLHAAFARQRVHFYLVFPGRRERAAAVRAHVAEFEYGIEPLLDPEHALVDRARVEVTPEVAVFGIDGEIAYAGRIDNRYLALGKARPEPTRRDLELALSAVLARRAVEPARTRAVGCAISD